MRTAITAALAALLLGSALAPQALAAEGIRRCAKGAGSAVRPVVATARNLAKEAALFNAGSYLRNGYRPDFRTASQSCVRKRQIFICRYSVNVCKYRHDN